MLHIKSNINVSSFDYILKAIIKIKALENDINLSESHINLILDFYNHGISLDTYNIHISKSNTNKNYFKSKPTIDNAKSYLKKNSIILVTKSGETYISPDFVPSISEENKKSVVLTFNIIYDKENK